MSSGLCEGSDCGRELSPNDSRNLCPKHYRRWRKHGDPNYTANVPREASWYERLHNTGWHVRDSGCWEWAGDRDTHGYGVISRTRNKRRQRKLAHRVALSEAREGIQCRYSTHLCNRILLAKEVRGHICSDVTQVRQGLRLVLRASLGRQARRAR